MKVLVLSHMYPVPYNEAYGIFVHDQVKALIEKGVKVKVISPTPWTPFPLNHLKAKWREYDRVPEQRLIDGIEVNYPRYLAFPRKFFFFSSGSRMYRGVAETVQEISDDFGFDLIHAHVALPDGFAGMKLAEDFDKPLVVNIHGADAYVNLDVSKTCKQNIIKVFESSKRIIPVSVKLQEVLVEKVGSWLKQKSTVIGNGIDSSKVLSNEDVNQETERNVILSVGYLIPRKAHKYVLKSLKKIVKRTEFDPLYLIIGNGPEKNNLRELVGRLNLEDHVRFLGLISNEEVMKYMAKADIFALPSWNEAFGVVYLEAMAHATPVIACKGEGIDGIVKNKETGLLVERKNSEDIFQAIKFLLYRPNKARRIGKKARELVMNDYTWPKNAKRTVEVYQEVLDGK